MTEPKRFDLASLVETSRPAKVMTAGNLNGPDNPFLHKVRESYRADQTTPDSGWQEITITGEQFDDVVNSLRGLSAWFGSTKNGKEAEPIGVHIRAEYQPDNAENTVEVGPKDFDDIPKDGREVFLKYTGRARLARGGRRRRTADAQQAASGPVNNTTDDDSVDEEMATA